ncbi:hypothetical protein ASC94_15740 [Massilia sp. Root418]|uniref:DUF4450 domain-containing protein n=1 Tax=Massilia sp. Root418 TaxID=1736532 RepID=UPI000700BCA7|nr:DUF4450 domain-containing protein [Massilia sp. Root418]KQW93994.1 hypothetical protein ASC94_15740 [Massilia sp. Root418]
MNSLTRRALAAAMLAQCAAMGAAAGAAPSATAGLRPNLEGRVQQPLRYRPDGPDFVIDNGTEFFNRSLYGGNTAFRADGGDKPEFLLYLPGRGGNLRLAVRTAAGVVWLHDAAAITARYRPGELRYEIRDPVLGADAVVSVAALAYARTEGLIVQAEARGLAPGAELVWAYGGVNGARGVRDGDIGTEKVAISEYFQFKPSLAAGNRIVLGGEGYTVNSRVAAIAGVVPQGSVLRIGDGAQWNALPALLETAAAPPGAAPEPGAKDGSSASASASAEASASASAAAAAAAAAPIVVGRVALPNGVPLLLSLQRLPGGAPAKDLDQYTAVTAGKPAAPKKTVPLAPLYAREQLPALFAETRQHFDALRRRVSIDTPDPYLNAAVGALGVAADALWDEADQAIMHGAIAWRTKLLGWRGPYALDALGWHARARSNLDAWTPRQNTQPIPVTLPPADAASNLARSEAGLHSNGDLSNSHYDMNMVFMDALFRHLLWTGDLEYARSAWPVIERHLAWERRLFRREFGPRKLPLYEAYANIWASDDLYYNGGGASHASAYNVYANRSAARIARLLGKDAQPYEREAELIAQAMRAYLWMPETGAFAEYKDLLGGQLLHPSYGLWSFYHTIDSGVPTPQEAWRMASSLKAHLKPIPVTGPGVPADASYQVLPTTNWMPYSWSINNVVMGENLHTALALWQAGRAADAFLLAKSALLASMYMGISPGNVGSMNYLDAYRRESQRDFADGAGVMSRAIVEGLFGLAPDALAGTLTVRPGFPAAWDRARLSHPDLGVDFVRSGRTERWTISQAASPAQAQLRFGKLALRIPAVYQRVRSVTVNGVPAQFETDRAAIGRRGLLVKAPMARETAVVIEWAGAPALSVQPEESVKVPGPARAAGPTPPAAADWGSDRRGAILESVNLAPYFNDKVTEIFKPGKYQSPRSPHVSLSLPAQGIGAWAGHVNATADIDDSGLRAAAAANGGKLAMPNGVTFATPGDHQSPNIVFTSQWDNYPRSAEIALTGKARRAWLLMAGSTNFMQSRIDNGEVVVRYADGSTTRLALHNPVNWWPIEQDYFIDDYQFSRPQPTPPRVDLKTGAVRLQSSGGMVPGGAATALAIALDPRKALRSLTVRTLSNDSVIGLMSVTLERP